MSASTAPSRPTDSAAKAALRWLPTFLGYPAGGLAAKLIVGPVDGPGEAIVGGLLSGLALGMAQSLVLKRYGVASAAWIAATTAGATVGISAGALAVDYRYGLGDLATQGAIAGALLGAAQATVIARLLGTLAAAWAPVLAGLWALGWTITSSVGVDVEARYTVFGSSGALVVTAVTAALPALLARTDPSIPTLKETP